MPIADDDLPREPILEPSEAELRTLEQELLANPLDLWKRRQTWLQELGHDPGPIDGAPGKKTKAAVLSFQRSARLVADGKWGPKTQAAVEVALGRALEPEPVVDPSESYRDLLEPFTLDDAFWASFVDLSKKSNVPDDEGRLRRKGSRAWSALTRIVWHQTAFTWKPYRELKAAQRWTSHHQINAHACFDTDGTILLIHPLESYLWTANAFNPSCLSFEIMGNFEGELGTGDWYRPETFGRARPTRIQLLRARQWTRWLLDPSQGPADDKLPKILLDWRSACVKLGVSPITWVNPHRGGTNDRSIDCGSECWYHVAEHTFAAYPQVTEGPIAGKGEPTPSLWRRVPIVPPRIV